MTQYEFVSKGWIIADNINRPALIVLVLSKGCWKINLYIVT